MILHKEVKTLTYSNREFCTHTLIFCHTCAFFSQSVYTVSKFGSLWSGWEYMRCSKASIFWMTFFSPWSWMPMSSIGSSKGTPSGKRFWTSYNKAWKINSSTYKISKTNFFLCAWSWEVCICNSFFALKLGTFSYCPPQVFFNIALWFTGIGMYCNLLINLVLH